MNCMVPEVAGALDEIHSPASKLRRFFRWKKSSFSKSGEQKVQF